MRKTTQTKLPSLFCSLETTEGGYWWPLCCLYYQNWQISHKYFKLMKRGHWAYLDLKTLFVDTRWCTSVFKSNKRAQVETPELSECNDQASSMAGFPSSSSDEEEEDDDEEEEEEEEDAEESLSSFFVPMGGPLSCSAAFSHSMSASSPLGSPGGSELEGGASCCFTLASSCATIIWFLGLCSSGRRKKHIYS